MSQQDTCDSVSAVCNLLSESEICSEENNAITPNRPAKKNTQSATMQAQNALSPTRVRNSSSISMSQVPKHMSSGQILPQEGLAAAVGAVTSAAEQNAEDDESDWDSEPEEDKAPLLPHEMLRPVIEFSYPATVPSKFASWSATEEALEYDSDSSDDSSGGVSITDFLTTDSRMAKMGQSKELEPFPEYDDNLAMRLLSMPDEPLTIPIRASVEDLEYVVVDRSVLRSARLRGKNVNEDGGAMI